MGATRNHRFEEVAFGWIESGKTESPTVICSNCRWLFFVFQVQERSKWFDNDLAEVVELAFGATNKQNIQNRVIPWIRCIIRRQGLDRNRVAVRIYVAGVDG